MTTENRANVNLDDERRSLADDGGAFNQCYEAALQGDVEAQTNLGAMYESGVGVEQDDYDAMEWYLRAACQGHVDAQYRLAVVLETVFQDYVSAARWYHEAAEQGDSGAQFVFGLFCSEGLGMKKDIPTAIRWLRKAAEQGDEDALEMLRDLCLKFEH